MSQFDLDAKARDIGLEGFNAPANLNPLHVWQLAGRKATIRLKRDREFADSPVEEIGFELVVPCRAASRQGPTNCPAIIIAVDDRNYLQT